MYIWRSLNSLAKNSRYYSIESRLKFVAKSNPPDHWAKILTLETHTGGEPFRIVLSGLPPLKGSSILAKRNYMKHNLDHFRKLLMREPRGHADMYGAVLVDSPTVDGDLGVIFMHNEGYSTMCGHGIIALTTALLETGCFPLSTKLLKIDAPAGRILAKPKVQNSKVVSVSFENVPSFVYMTDETIDVEGVGKVKFDIAYGGAFYAYVDVRKNMNLWSLLPEDASNLVSIGMKIKKAIMDKIPIKHPFEQDLSFLYGVIFVGSPVNNKDKNEEGKLFSRNVCIFADGQVDRSPTGTGVSGRVALEYNNGTMKKNDELVVESIVGSIFYGRVADNDVTYGNKSAVIPEVEGSAFIMGRNEFLVDPDDTLQEGFILK
eukprot:TRINITY_DN1499_c0_g1_i11.p2 TRINITY_DN1499_c0_g1~~TRINITY_DN1499_c0_g1_i11.p2  ORF type:complete len:375 (-),score=51.74 TRINITY_DN1499_c0_g1_i11:3683-4807(-)